MSRSKAVGLMLTAAVLWSTGGFLIKSIDMEPMAIAAGRSGILALVFLIWLRKPKFTWSLPQVGAAIMCGTDMILFVLSTTLTTAASAIVLQYTTPVYVALLSTWYLGERINWKDWISIAAVVAGVALFFFEDLDPDAVLGNVLALLGGFCLAWMVLFLRKQKDGSPYESILLGNTLAFLVGMPWLISGGIPDIESGAFLTALGVFQLAIPYLLYVSALKYVTALDSTIIPAIEPLLNPLLTAVIIAEFPGEWAIPGGILVLGSVLFRSIQKQAHK